MPSFPDCALCLGSYRRAPVSNNKVQLSGHSFCAFVRSSHVLRSADVEGLLQHRKGKPQRQAEWQEAVTAETEALREEDGDFGDLLLVDGVDVYRSLPSKLLRCHEW